MNAKQQKVIRVGIVLIVLMTLFPPWVQTYNHVQVGSAKVPASYSFIGKPPPAQTGGPYYGVQLDVTRLLFQWVAVGLAVAGLVCCSRDPQR